MAASVAAIKTGREGDTRADDPAAEAGQPRAHLNVIHLDPDLIQNAERGLVDLLQAGGGCEEVILWHAASCPYSIAYRALFEI